MSDAIFVSYEINFRSDSLFLRLISLAFELQNRTTFFN